MHSVGLRAARAREEEADHVRRTAHLLLEVLGKRVIHEEQQPRTVSRAAAPAAAPATAPAGSLYHTHLTLGLWKCKMHTYTREGTQ